MAWDHRLCRAVLAVFVRAVLGLQRRRARRRGLRGGVGGAVTAIQRSGAALNLNVHFHGLVADGVFIPTPDGGPVSCPCRRPRTRRWRSSSPRSASASSDSHAGAASRSVFDLISVSAGVRGTQILLHPADYLRATGAALGPIARTPVADRPPSGPKQEQPHPRAY